MPIHVQLIIILSTASVVFCLFLGLLGFISSKRPGVLPPAPLFPGNKVLETLSPLLTVCFGLLFVMNGVKAYMLQGPDEAATPDLPFFILNCIVTIAFYLPFISIFFFVPSRITTPASLATKAMWVFSFLLLMLIPGLIMDNLKISEWIAEVTGAPLLQDVVTSIQDGPFAIQVITMAMAIFVAPITEEIYFRGFVYNILKKWSGAVPAAIASSFLFGIVHTSIPQLIPLTMFALIQCWAYEKARSLWLPIVLHMLFNAISCIVIICS